MVLEPTTRKIGTVGTVGTVPVRGSALQTRTVKTPAPVPPPKREQRPVEEVKRKRTKTQIRKKEIEQEEAEDAPVEIKMYTVRSSNVAAIGYDPESQILQVRFKSNNATYRYYDVPKTVWTAFRRAKSKGKFVWRRLRSVYEYERIS